MLGKSLHLCCSRFKRPSSSTPPQIQNPLHIPSSTSTSSSSSILFKNFNSLYDPTLSSDSEILITSSTSQTLTLTPTSSSENSEISDYYGPHLSTAIATGRLFPASPGRSKSIIDSSAVIGGGGVAVETYSPDPYRDFRRSMEEMVVALGLDSMDHDHQYRVLHLHELLLCYLALNRKNAHKYIVGAFADLLVDLADSDDR